MEINGSIFFVVIFAFLGLVFLQPVERFFLAAVSTANVYVPATQENNPPPVVSSGGGGGYYPTILTPIVPPTPPTPVIPGAKQPKQPNITKNPAVPPENVQQPLVATSLLPAAVADLSAKIPEFASVLSNLGVNNAEDVAGLSNYNIFLPGLKEITKNGAMPSDTVFVLLGNENIDASTKLNFSENATALQEVNVLTQKPMHLVVKPSGAIDSVAGYVLFNNFPVLKFTYSQNSNGVYSADINSPAVVGRYQIVTSINYANAKLGQKEIKTAMLTDPDGYIFEKTRDGELRISGAEASLYKLNDKGKYELWNANNYGQENPQSTNNTGNYSFLVPAGTYYLSVSSPGYYSYKSNSFSVIEGKEIHSNVALKKNLIYLRF